METMFETARLVVRRFREDDAQALYEKCGFVPTGRRSRALKFDDGTYHDEIIMVKYLDQEAE